MTKARVQVGFREVKDSPRTNELIGDYLRRGQLVCNNVGCLVETPDATERAVHGLASTGYANTWIYLGMYPYNPAKQIFNRMRMNIRAEADANLGANWGLEYTLNSGATWVDSVLGALQPSWPLSPMTGTPLSALSGTQDLGLTQTAPGWLGWRLYGGGLSGNEYLTWIFNAFLYYGDQHPF